MKKKSMMRKIVNLSPLVDVFMIVIFWYIMFSNQNLQNQETNSQIIIEGLQQEVKGLEENLEKIEVAKGASDEYIEELLEELKRLKEELTEIEGNAAVLKTENEKLAALLEQEGQYLVLQLTGGVEKLRILEVTYEGNLERITFTDDELQTMQNNLEVMVLKYLENNTRLSVLFLYSGSNSFAKDVSAIGGVLEKIQKENYFVYTKMNLTKSGI